MVTAIPRLRQDIIDIVFPGMKEQELLKWVETDFESFLKEWKKQPGTAASLELITELQALYPEKFERPEIPLAEEEEPPIELTPEQVVRLPTTQTQDGWTFRDIAWNIAGEAINYIAVSPTGEEYTKAELDIAIIRQEDYELLYKEYQRTGGELEFEDWVSVGAPIRPEEEPERLSGAIADVYPDLTLEEFVEFVETDFEGFVEEMRTGGATEENVALLRQLGYPQEQIDAFYGVTISAPVPPQPPAGVGKFQLGLTKTLESAYGTELVQEVATNLNKDYFDVSNEEVEAYIVANPDVARRVQERQKEYPALTLWEEVKIFGQSLLKLPGQWEAAILQAFQGALGTEGLTGASVTDPDWADRRIKLIQADMDKFLRETAEEYGGRPSLLGITPIDLAQFSQNLAFSTISMGAGVVTGVPIALAPIPGARYYAWAAGTAASGVVAYQITTYQIMQQYLELENEKSKAEKGRGITREEEEQLKADFASKAHRYGLWEAVPEAISNLSFALLLTKPLKLMGLEKHFIRQILAKITGMYGQELLTETITQKGQSAIEVEAGLREGRISWAEAFKEIAPQTFLLTTVMAGAGQTIISSTNAVKKIRASLSAEIGETHPLYDGFLDEALKHYEETTIPFVKPPTITPTEAVVTPTEVPVTPAIEKFLATPDEQIIRPSSEVIDALKARGFSDDYIQTKMSIPEMKQALQQPIPAVPAVPEARTPYMERLQEYADIDRFARDMVAENRQPAEIANVEQMFNFIADYARIADPNGVISDAEVSVWADDLSRRVDAHIASMEGNETVGWLRVEKDLKEISKGLKATDRATQVIALDHLITLAHTMDTTVLPQIFNTTYMMATGRIDRIRGILDAIADGKIIPKPPAVKVAKPPVEKLPAVTEEIIGLPPPTEPISRRIAENTQGLNEITAKEELRPSRKVFIKMGIWRDFYKPMSRAEALINEERIAFGKERKAISKLIGKDAGRRALVWDEVNKKGSVVGLTFDEKRAVARIREWADRWADRKNLPESKRIKDYIPHLFEEEMIREIREENGIDPVLARILDERFAGKITDPFLKKRLGKEIGLLKDPIAAMEAYDNVSLKTIYYAPMLNKINAYMSDINIPEGSRAYLRNYARRMTGELATTDIAINKMIGEFAEAIRKAPVFGEWMYNKLATGNPAGMAAYNLTSALYGLWLGFKFTSAIRNLSQHALIIADVGPVHFANAFRLGLTAEGKALWRDSVNRRSRKRAFLPGYDSSFIAGWTQSFIDTSLKMFRGADWANTHSAFLAGCSEAKVILTEANDKLPVDKKLPPERLREYIIDRGDEVFADTQYLYTKMNSMAFAQNAPGRVLSMLTTWTGNWMELMAKWIKRTPSQVYLEFERETGVKVTRAAWATSYKAILLYMMIVGLGFAIKERTRLKAWEYTGITSVRYLADIIGGDFPALQAPGGVADTIVGFLTQDERRLNEGLYTLKSTFTPSVMKQLDSIAAGDKDWLTFFFYLEGRNIFINRLKNEWEKGWKEYPLFETPEDKAQYIEAHPEHRGWSDSKIRNQWRENNPLLEAQMFITGKFTVLSTDKARTEALRLIEEHKLDTELIDGYEKVFGVDTRAELQKFQDRIGDLEDLVAGEEAKYFTMGNYVSEVNALVNVTGRHKVQSEGSPLTRAILEAQDTFEAYEIIEEADGRILWRQQYPEGEAWLYLLDKVQSFKNPKSAEILLSLMKKYDIPPEAIRAFIDKPERYDDLFTQKFELEQKWFDQTTEYENFGNTQAPNYIEDAELRKEARAKFKEDNPDWVADMRRIEAIDNDVPDKLDGINGIDAWADRGKEIDKFGSGSSEALVWLLDHPDTYDWAIANELLEDRKKELLEREPILRIDVKYATEDDWYNEGIPARHAGVAYKNRAARDAGIAEERSRYLADNPEYNKARYRRDAYGLKDENFNPFPDELVETYVDYYTNPDLKKPDDWEETSGTDEWYEDDWFLQENPEFHQALVDYGKFTELRDLSKVPTREVFTLYQEYLGIEGSQARLNFRHAHPDLENWMVEAKGFKPVGDRWTTTDPELANKKYWLGQARHFKGLLADLGIREDITAEELTDEEYEQIKKAIRAFYD